MGCWDRLQRLNYELDSLLDTAGEISAAELLGIRGRMSSTIKACRESAPFYNDISAVEVGPDSYYTLLDFAIMANDPELTAEMFERQRLELSVEFRRDSLISGESHLETAVYSESDQVVLWLLENGSDPNQTNDIGASALHFSGTRTESGLRVTRDLVTAGADIDIRAENDVTPLIIALRRGDLRKVQCLVSLGAQVPDDVEAVEILPQFLVDPNDVLAAVEFLKSPNREIPDHIASICSTGR